MLVSFVVNKGLVLRDKQKPDELLWHPDMLCHTEKFRCRERATQLIQGILHRIRGIRALIKMAEWLDYGGAKSTFRTLGYAAYAVVFNRRPRESSLEERVLEFHNALHSLLASDEYIRYEDKGFWVASNVEKWRIYFCIEAYGHNPTMTVHMDAESNSYCSGEAGPLTSEPLRRPGTQKLLRETRVFCSGQPKDSSIIRRMGATRIQS